MKRLLTALALTATLGFTACNESPEGGPNATKPDNQKPAVGQTDNTFKLSAPTLATSLTQGESKTVSISISRGKNFDEDVALKFSDLPKGVTIEPAAPMIKHGDSEAKLTVTAAGDAALGDHLIKATGHPTKGADTFVEFRITVKEK
jgi:uncharacterized membrane protein